MVNNRNGYRGRGHAGDVALVVERREQDSEGEQGAAEDADRDRN